MLITFLVFAGLSAVFLIGFLAFNWKSTRGRAISVPGLEPVNATAGNLPDITAAGSFHVFLLELHQKFGQIASFWFGPTLCVSVSSVEGFKATQSLFDRPAEIFEFAVPLITRKSLQFLNGSAGKRKHKLYSEPFNHKSCVKLLPEFSQICSELRSNWSSQPAETHLPLHDYMMALAIKLITQTQFGIYFKNDENTRRHHKVYESVMTDMDELMTGKFQPERDVERQENFVRSLALFKSMVMDVVKEHEEQRRLVDYAPAPFLDSLLDNTAHDPEEAMADAIGFMVGGFHTTGNFLTWTFYYLTIFPEVQDRVVAEMKTVMGSGAELSEEHVTKLVYTKAVLDEVLRCSTQAPFAARVNNAEDMRIMGHMVPKGTPIVHALGVANVDEKYFEAPDSFNPDRFLEEQRPNLAFVPFGMGVRRCPGYKFSYYEVLATLAQVIPTLELRPAFTTDYHVEPQYGFVTKPETEIWVKVYPRK